MAVAAPESVSAYRQAAVFDALGDRSRIEESAEPGPLTPPGPGSRRYTLRVPVEACAEVLAGHYPGVPIMPGVLVVDCVCQLLAEVSGGTLRIAAIERIRFVNPLLPGDELALTLTLTEGPTADEVRALVRGHRSDGSLANEMRLRLRPERTGGVADDRA